MSLIKDPLRGWFGDLSIYDEAYEKTIKSCEAEVRNCVIIRNAVVCMGYLLMDKHIINNTLEEVKADFEASLFLATHGFYKYSMSALRSVLEVCFEGLSYHYKQGKYQDWLQGARGRIDIKSSFKSLRKNSSLLKAYDEKYDLLKEVYDDLCASLSLFVHTQGQRCLEIEKRNDIIPHYNPKAFDEWYMAYRKTFEVIATTFLLVFPQILASEDTCIQKIFTSLPKNRLETINETINVLFQN